MKKVVVLLLTFSFCNLLAAQEIKLGVKGGVNFASLSGDTSGLESRTTFHVGVLSEVFIADKFSIQPELQFSAQGARDSEFDESIKLNYLNFPILAKYYIADGVSFEAGPQIGLLLSANSEIDGEDEDIKNAIKDIDLGVGLGLSYKLDSGLFFSGRYNLGLSNIFDDNDGFGEDFKINNSVFQISVGYFLNNILNQHL